MTFLRRPRLRPLLALVGTLLLPWACSDSGGPVTPDTPTLSVSLASSSVSIVAGQSGQIGVNIVRGGGFSGAVTVSATAPAGVTISPVTIPVGSTSGTLTVQVGGTVAAGTLQATISAAGTGVTTATTPLAITVTSPPDFAIALGAATATVAQGGTATATVNITRSGGFTGAVNLTATGLPTGVTASFNPAAPTGATSTLTLTAAAGAAVGTSTVTVNATGQGVTGTKTAALALTVSAPGPTPDFSLSVTPATVSFEQGKTATANVAINRTGGFTGAVNLAVTGLPTGVTASFAAPLVLDGPAVDGPAETTGSQATLTLTAGATAAVGTVTLTVTGTATGISARTTTLGATVTAATGGGSGNVSLGFCGDEEIPVWAAFQDGNGPWTRVAPDANKVFRFQINGDRGGFAYVTQSESGPIQFVLYYTRAEMIALGSDSCAIGGGKVVNGSVSGLGPLESAIVSLGGATANVSTGGPTNFTLSPVEEGPQDLVAARWAISLSGSSPSFTPNRIIIRRNLNPAAGSTLPVLNFATEGFAPASATLSLTGGGAGEQAIFVGLFSTDKGAVSSYFVGLSGGFSTPYYGVPTAELRTGDVHLIQAIASANTDPTSGIPPATRQVGAAFREVTNRSVALGPVLSTPTVSPLSGGSHGRLRVQLPLQTEYRRFVAASFNQEQGDQERVVQILTTGDYLGAGSTADLSIPDLSGVSGWNNAWGLVRGVPAIWTASGTGWTGPGFLDLPNLTDGARYLSATRSGQITP